MAVDGEDGAIPFAGGSFDLVINRHDSYEPEVLRVLRPGGWFVTLQAGELDGVELDERLQARVHGHVTLSQWWPGGPARARSLCRHRPQGSLVCLGHPAGWASSPAKRALASGGSRRAEAGAVTVARPSRDLGPADAFPEIPRTQVGDFATAT